MQSLVFERHSIAPLFYGAAKRTMEAIVKFAIETRHNGKRLAGVHEAESRERAEELALMLQRKLLEIGK